MQRIHNSAARMIIKIRRITTSLLISSSFIGSPSRITLIVKLNWTNKCLNSLAPDYLTNLFRFQDTKHYLRSSTAPVLYVPKTKLKYYSDWAFAVAASKL